MKLTVVLAVLIGTLVLACSTAAPAPVEPTPNIDATAVVEPTLDIEATVEARLAQERAVDATVEARLEEERASQPTSIPSPTNTFPPKPASTVVPQPTNTLTPILQPMVRGQKDSAIEVTVYNAEKVWPGTTLLSDHHDVGSPRVIEVNMLGEVTWQYVLAEDFKQYTNPGRVFSTEISSSAISSSFETTPDDGS